MPYYCTVPRCTSTAGKAKNVSFHQFPKDESLAKVWNEILKRGKPYTKYSKVCSLHFKPEDYTITGLGRNKGQWRTLRKDAVPSQNLPLEISMPYQKSKNSGSLVVNNIYSDSMDSQLNQIAQAIYNGTVLALHSSGVLGFNMSSVCNGSDSSSNTDDSTSRSSNSSGNFSEALSQIEHLLYRNNINHELNRDSAKTLNNNEYVSMFSPVLSKKQEFGDKHTYKCAECSRCFKDPDVYVLHKRMHNSKSASSNVQVIKHTYPKNDFSEKENFNTSNNHLQEYSSEETLRANPILANLLKSTIPQIFHKGNEMQRLDTKNVTSIENQIMMDFTCKMKNYFTKDQSTIISKENNGVNVGGNSVCEVDDNSLVDFSNGVEKIIEKNKSALDNEENLNTNCDNEDLNETLNSNNLVINGNPHGYMIATSL